MSDIYSIPTTYSGLLDDVVDRYRITPEVDETFFSRSILRNVFFAGPILINDGYLVNHPAALTQLLKEGSLLREMIKSRFVTVLARQKDPEAFASNPEKMAERGIQSFGKLVQRSDWPELKRRLQDLAEAWFSYDVVKPWPRVQMNKGFHRLFQRTFDKTNADLGLPESSIFKMDEFRKRLELSEVYDAAPRTAVEQIALSMHSEGLFDRKVVTEIMNIANQCYHYNFAMCASYDQQKPVVADTTIGLAFEDILNLEQAVEADLSKVPMLSIPKGFPIEDGRIFDSFFDIGGSLDRAKHRFLKQIDDVFAGVASGTVEDGIKDLEDISIEYRKKLEEHFSQRVSLKDWAPRRAALLTFGFGKIGSAVGGENYLLAANLAGGKSVSSFIHRLTRGFQRQFLNTALDPNAGEREDLIFRAGDVRPRFASLAFDQNAVDAHASTLPKFDSD